jgi:hypothetical protein
MRISSAASAAYMFRFRVCGHRATVARYPPHHQRRSIRGVLPPQDHSRRRSRIWQHTENLDATTANRRGWTGVSVVNLVGISDVYGSDAPIGRVSGCMRGYDWGQLGVGAPRLVPPPQVTS